MGPLSIDWFWSPLIYKSIHITPFNLAALWSLIKIAHVLLRRFAPAGPCVNTSWYLPYPLHTLHMNTLHMSPFLSHNLGAALWKLWQGAHVWWRLFTFGYDCSRLIKIAHVWLGASRRACRLTKCHTLGAQWSKSPQFHIPHMSQSRPYPTYVAVWTISYRCLAPQNPARPSKFFAKSYY